MEETTKNIKYILEDGNLSIEEAKVVINTLIDNRINTYKLKYLSAWEKDHTISNKEIVKIIAQLNERRTLLINDLEKRENVELGVSVNASFVLDIAS
ncbi:MAG: hypothetical protein AB8B72_10375 [Crocinitomicaceae bacterium]